jgi:hypothetical protein
MEQLFPIAVRLFSAIFCAIALVIYAVRHKEPTLYSTAFGMTLIILAYLLMIFDNVRPDEFYDTELISPGTFLVFNSLALHFMNGLIGNPIKNSLVKFQEAALCRLQLHFPSR